MVSIDILLITCHNCNRKNSYETMLSKKGMMNIGVGGFFNFLDCILLLKDDCPFCGLRNAIEIKDNIILGVHPPSKASIEELPFSEIKYLNKNNKRLKI